MDFSKLYEYFIVLFFKYNYKDISSLNKKNYDLDEIYKYIYSFWLSNFDKKLDLSKDEDKEKLFDFLNDIFKYKLLNYCLSELYENLTDNKKDEFMINNLSTLSDIVKIILNEKCDLDYKEDDLPKLTHEELDRYFKEFLLFIDSGGDFLKAYEELKNNDRINYLDELDEKEKKYFKMLFYIEDDSYNNFTMKNNENYSFIVIDRKGNISDFRTLTHEFMHYYINYCNNGKKPHFLLEEFPSMFYEYIANEFLLTKGYSYEDINKLYMFRFKEISDKSLYLTSINYYLKLYNDNNFNVTHKLDVEKVKEKIEEFIEKNGKEEFEQRLINNKNFNNPAKMANDNCEVANIYLAIDSCDLVKNYPYLIGHFLSLYYIKEITNNKITLKEIKKMTENLSNMNPNIILEIYKKEKEINKSLIIK